MTGLIVIGCLILLIIIILQIGKVSELSAEIRGHEASVESSSRSNGILMLLYGILFFVGIIWFNFHMKNWLLGFGPHLPASEHGATLDSLFLWTTIITGIVFVLTHIALFWFTFKYRHRKGHKASFMAHNTKLELIWTFVPSFVLTLLIIKGMVGWNQIMADTSVDDDYMEIEAMGQQFAWLLRYPGADGQLGDRNFRLISGSNPFGQDLSDKRNDDDFHPSEIVLPVGATLEPVDNEIGEIFYKDNKWWLKVKKLKTASGKELEAVHSGNLNDILLPTKLPPYSILRRDIKEAKEKKGLI